MTAGPTALGILAPRVAGESATPDLRSRRRTPRKSIAVSSADMSLEEGRNGHGGALGVVEGRPVSAGHSLEWSRSKMPTWQSWSTGRLFGGALTSVLGRHSTEKVSIPWDLVKTEQEELRLSGDWLIGASLSQ